MNTTALPIDVIFAFGKNIISYVKPELATLNKRNELVSSYRHARKCLLMNI